MYVYIKLLGRYFIEFYIHYKNERCNYDKCLLLFHSTLQVSNVAFVGTASYSFFSVGWPQSNIIYLSEEAYDIE